MFTDEELHTVQYEYMELSKNSIFEKDRYFLIASISGLDDGVVKYNLGYTAGDEKGRKNVSSAKEALQYFRYYRVVNRSL